MSSYLDELKFKSLKNRPVLHKAEYVIYSPTKNEVASVTTYDSDKSKQRSIYRKLLKKLNIPFTDEDLPYSEEEDISEEDLEDELLEDINNPYVEDLYPKSLTFTTNKKGLMGYEKEERNYILAHDFNELCKEKGWEIRFTEYKPRNKNATYGAKGSKHKEGLAFDFKSGNKNISNEQLLMKIKNDEDVERYLENYGLKILDETGDNYKIYNGTGPHIHIGV